MVLAGAPKPWAGSQLACVSRAHWGTPQPFVAVTARVGMWTRAGRNSPAPCRVYFEMCLWVAGRCNENLAYRDTHSWKHCVTENPSAANLNT